MIAQWSREVLNYIQQYMNHSVLPYIYLAGVLFLFFRGKEKRRMVAWASVWIMVVILNPICYGLIWTKLVTYAFWRMLWMIPIIPVIACAVLELAGICRFAWARPIITCLFIVAMFLCGDNIYAQPGTFIKAENAYKLPQQSVELSEKLLELEEEPMVLVPFTQYCYLRLYSGRIHMVYGRDADAYIKPIEDADTLELYGLMSANGGDAERFTTLARQKQVNLIVLFENHEFGSLEAYGYEKVAEVDNMWIYKDVR